MNIGVIGIDFSKLSAEEKARVVSTPMPDSAFQRGAGSRSVVLSTCHRFEVFFSGHDLTRKAIDIIHLLQEMFSLGATASLYSFFSYDCFFHLAKVACGLNSKIFGEDEILRQVKTAYGRDKMVKKLDFELHFLFQKCLRIGKEIRSKLEPRQKAPGIPALVASIGRKHWGTLKEKKQVLLIGNSMINRKIYGYLTYRTDFSIQIATSKPQNKKSLPLVARTKDLFNTAYDMIIAAGQSKGYLVSVVHADTIAKKTLLIDLGAARNIDPRLDAKRKVYTLEEVESYHKSSQEQEEIALCIEAKLKELVKKYILIYEEKLKKKEQFEEQLSMSILK